MAKELFGNMSDDFKAKMAACKSKEEFDALIKEENIELTPEQVDALAGGAQNDDGCPCYVVYIDCLWINH